MDLWNQELIHGDAGCVYYALCDAALGTLGFPNHSHGQSHTEGAPKAGAGQQRVVSQESCTKTKLQYRSSKDLVASVPHTGVGSDNGRPPVIQSVGIRGEPPTTHGPALGAPAQTSARLQLA